MKKKDYGTKQSVIPKSYEGVLPEKASFQQSDAVLRSGI